MSAPLPVTAVAFLARASQLGLFSAETLILLDRGVARNAIGLVMAAAAAGGALAQLAAGRWGHRCRTTRLTLLGTGVQSVGCLAFATLTPWWSLAAADFLLMAGAALTATGLRATLAAHAPGGRAPGPDRLERAYGRLTAAQMLGALVGPLGAGAVLLHGGPAWAAWAATAVALGAAAVAGTADRRGHAAANRPGAARPAAEKLPAPEPPASAAGPRLSLPATLWTPLVLLFGITALYGGYSVVWAVYLRDLGARNALIAWSAACLALPALVLSPRAGSVLPRVSRPALLRCAALLLGCCACLYPLVGSVAAAVALSLAEGILLAVALPLISAQVARDAGPGRTARAFGLLGTADALGSGLGTALGGALLAQGGAAEAFRFSGVLCLLCAAASLIPLSAGSPRPPSPPQPSSAPTSPPPAASCAPTTRPSFPSSETGRSPHVSRPSPRIRPVRR
ncbi:putative MFS family arabinose efflux permease [Streptomyces sp. 3330]|uniref:MFS transporter n=1 Tax=Streptomyces sp. 3330 TaxID=2817755 RepID=UPI002864F36A|nr:MFS transporter [Streptomyces sp. 3330]MDR6979074.1 putative MFS family arabinose efflux permease [Streptomyces sp. 3330]